VGKRFSEYCRERSFSKISGSHAEEVEEYIDIVTNDWGEIERENEKKNNDRFRVPIEKERKLTSHSISKFCRRYYTHLRQRFPH
jgi:cell division septum initiation protein DivIVA